VGERSERRDRVARGRPSPLRETARAGRSNNRARGEEKVLYPALEPHATTHDIVLEGYQEHHVADLLLRELHQLAKDDEKWGAKFRVLEENLAHHIEEEERKMFPTARAVLTTEELNEIGARMKALKAELEER
jgi:hemerythrin-like domain-containing protein